jgi:hypothetical protein
MEATIANASEFAGSHACADCVSGLEHCHESSIEHADGFTECLDSSCRLDHGLHTWQLSCSVFDPPCACAPDEAHPYQVAALAPAMAVAA